MKQWSKGTGKTSAFLYTTLARKFTLLGYLYTHDVHDKAFLFQINWFSAVMLSKLLKFQSAASWKNGTAGIKMCVCVCLCACIWCGARAIKTLLVGTLLPLWRMCKTESNCWPRSSSGQLQIQGRCRKTPACQSSPQQEAAAPQSRSTGSCWSRFLPVFIEV